MVDGFLEGGIRGAVIVDNLLVERGKQRLSARTKATSGRAETESLETSSESRQICGRALIAPAEPA
jgi:hypothetical protein